MKNFLISAICVVMASCADRSVVYTPEHWPEKIRGSIFRPKTDKPAPAVLLIHGGVKLGQDGRWVMNHTAEKLRKRGYYVFSITYRSLSESTYPSQLRDVRMALKWMYENAEAEGINQDRLAVFGYSAGGYLGALAALDKREGDFGVKAIVAGGTPTFPIHARRRQPGLECSPGTCVLWDAGYAKKFPDLPFHQAAWLLTRCISRPGPGELDICLDLGHKAVASEMPPPRVIFPAMPKAKAIMHNEEHLVLRTALARGVHPGAVFYGIPWHVCPTVALHSECHVIRSRRAVDIWPIVARARRITI